MIVEEWCRRAARIAPQATAVECGPRRCTWSEMLAAAQAGAQRLAERGVARGDLVAIEMPPGVDFAHALHSVWLAGARAMPLDLRMTKGERDALCEGVSIRVSEPLAPAPWHSVSNTHAVVADGTMAAGEALTDAIKTSTSPQQAVREAFGHDLEAVAAVLHTSGTTSKPKRVELTFGNFLYSALGSAVALGAHPRERWLCTLPVCHVGGLSILVRSAIFATTAVIHERFETERALRALMEEEITIVSVVSTTLSRLLDAGLKDPPALRCALAGGGPVPPELLRRAAAAGAPVSQTYGLTESCSQASTVPLAALGGASEPEAACLGAGRPLFCTKIEIAPDGEILLSGPTIAKSALLEDGKLHTGDIGVFDEHGNLHVTGRKADTIVSGGENVAPAEVEAVIEAHPHVLEAAVVGRPHPEWGETVTAIVVPRPGRSITFEQLREHCAERLAPFKVPKSLMIEKAPLPRTRSGKLLRRELTGSDDREKRELDE